MQYCTCIQILLRSSTSTTLTHPLLYTIYYILVLGPQLRTTGFTSISYEAFKCLSHGVANHVCDKRRDFQNCVLCRYGELAFGLFLICYFPPGRRVFILYSRLRPYCRTFQYSAFRSYSTNTNNAATELQKHVPSTVVYTTSRST